MIPSAFSLSVPLASGEFDGICLAFVKTEKANFGSEAGNFSKEPSSRSQLVFEPGHSGVRCGNAGTCPGDH